MRCSGLQLLRLLPIVPLILQTSFATPLQTDSELAQLSNSTLSKLGKRWCDGGTICGYYSQLCCDVDERCYTGLNDQASCTPAPSATASGRWVYYTKTYIVTNRITKTKVYSSFIGYTGTSPAAATTTQKEAHCYRGQIPCGPICCKSWQYCVVQGQCGSHRGSFSAPARVTSVESLMPTTVVETTTVGFQPAVTPHHHHHHHKGGGITVAEHSSTSLSGGAIAGIVIGVLLGIFLLILLCLFFCFASAWNALLAFFGLGRRRRKETVEVEEYHHHGSRADNRRWYGGGGGASRPPPPKKKKDGGGFGWGTVFLGLAGLWAALGFKRRQDKKRVERSEVSQSSGYYSGYYTESSSDRRTRDTRRSSRR